MSARKIHSTGLSIFSGKTPSKSDCAYRQWPSRQYRGQRWTVPPRTIAHERSPVIRERHQAAVRDPPADPSETHTSVGPRTRACPSDDRPCAPPSKATSAALAAPPVAGGQGWFGLQVSSTSRAAMPASRTRGPSAHQIGPSPSQTLVGVHVKLVPAETAVGRAALAGDPAQSPAYANVVRAATW